MKGLKGMLSATAGLSVVHHAACLDLLTAQGEMEMDRYRQGESAQNGGRGRCGREEGKVGGGAGDVFIDHSAPSADMAATGLLFVGRDTIYLQEVFWRMPLCPHMHALWRLHFIVKVKPCPLSSFSHRDGRMCVRSAAVLAHKTGEREGC